MQFVRTAKTKAPAAARIGRRAGAQKREELLRLLRPCFARTGPWLQAGKYVSALVSGMPRRNGWPIAEAGGARARKKPQRLLTRAVWDPPAAGGVVRGFPGPGRDGAFCRSGRRRGLVV